MKQIFPDTSVQYNLFQSNSLYNTQQKWLEYKPSHIKMMPFLFSSPHSGRIYPKDFMQDCGLSIEKMRVFEDFCVDYLFDFVPSLKAHYLKCNLARVFLDINRSLDKFDLVTSIKQGIIPFYNQHHRAIYTKIPTEENVALRFDHVFTPYHTIIHNFLEKSIIHNGVAWLIDCHSMPLNSIKNMLHPCPDIIIGDCHQQSCTHYYSQYLSQLMQKHGLNVVHNHIFSGGYITKNYGNPAHLTFALQIEINRSLYMCEKKLRLKNSFFTLKSTLKNIFSEFMAHILKLTTYSMSVAAE